MGNRNLLGDVKTLLDFLTENFPPGEKQRHVIGIEDDKLTAWLFLGDLYLPLVFEDDDFYKPLSLLCNELAEVARQALIKEGHVGYEND